MVHKCYLCSHVRSNELCWCHKICFYRLTIEKMLFLASVLIILMFFYSTPIFFVLNLLFLSSLSLFTLATSYNIHSLLFIMLLIVYVGAMMILIGYICAICPNIRITSNPPLVPLLLLLFSGLFRASSPISSFYSTPISIQEYFYSEFGLECFLLLVLLLFITLLIVTSQYLSPKGPFRSVTT